MATLKSKPPSDKIKAAKVDELLKKIPVGKKPTNANAQKALDALELVRGEDHKAALRRRGLKM